MRYNSEQVRDQVDQWHERASLALQKGNEVLAREALARCRPYEDTARTLCRQLESQAVQVEDLQRNLLKLEGKFAQAKAKRSTLKARIQVCSARKHLEWGGGGINTESAMDVFERMEEKVEAMEAGTATVAHSFPDLSGDWESMDLEGRFQELKARLRSGK